MMALDALCGAVPPEMVPTISKKETAKKAWYAIATMRVGVKKAMAQQLHRKFDLATFDDGETIEDYALRLSGMAADLATLGKEVKDGEIITKMLRSLPPRFKQITIKTLLDVSTMSVVDLIGRLREAEEAFEEAPTSLQQDGKLYVIEEEWDARRKKREAENHSDSGARGGGTGKGRGAAGVAVTVALHHIDRRASPPAMSVGTAVRWGIGRVSAARSPKRSRRTSRKMRRRPRSCS
jgi:hypothetical protein